MDYWEKANHSWSEDSKEWSWRLHKEAGIYFYIQEIGYFKAPIPYYTERAHLPSYLIKFTLSGKGSLTYNDNQQQLKAGDLFLLTAKNISVIKRSAKNHGKWIGSIWMVRTSNHFIRSSQKTAITPSIQQEIHQKTRSTIWSQNWSTCNKARMPVPISSPL